MARNLTLLTDLYQLTMAQGYWQQLKPGIEACFYMFFRDNPFKGGYAVSCGMDQVVELIEGFGFDDGDIDYLAGLKAPSGAPLFDEAFLEWLGGMELEVDIDAVPDGTVVFPREPLLRVTGPLMQCQLLETCILNGVNFQTLIATKAARVAHAAAGRGVAEFGLRRAQGPDGGMSGDRAAFVGGCGSVANVLAGKRYGIPVSGTHAHSWVMSFPDELSAFRAWVSSMPGNSTLLVDTYDVEQGVRNAITVGLEMRERGEHLNGIRIDSGDLAWLSRKARAMLDEAGLEDTSIVLSNDLDEYLVESLIDQGACFDAIGIGTHLITGNPQPALGGVYKLSAVKPAGYDEWIPKIKLSEATVKITTPGVLDTMRFTDADGMFCGDVVFDVGDGCPVECVGVDPMDATHRKRYGAQLQRETLLKPLVRGGRVVEGQDSSDPHAAKARCKAQLARLDGSIKRFYNPHRYPAGLEKGLHGKRDAMIRELRGADMY
ncbi:MAG: nicotinate phosphoribosyltransferase [Coriobacteriales bacterium]|nr:nicotinate phosphoribosyltransferase [Coriobacteriales bacterium]